ncbi:PQQ-binding-like beta-propeller repeat protein [Streptomyces sp. NBC_01762]|uniref:outer membrane protein assembly factor BamB family protein n=1 Tax=Streptomyces sp. NBC_01762 TaxID=2975933 RepID=UPI002DDB851A|nr:PQQ-binding-like beta-propeller repeat protein [Streptomyces sp. NBC_01762]WSC42571.1 PQQ-binding-like beta-propeller repeat protein [Streptomyces sp. NBC_01762]WSC50282.1 PQQ-binding-like beta-propeller repeat protein [Streptomyces sp. NBC_01762]
MGGRILAGRYQLDRLLGRGGMGEVWEAHDTVIQRHVAVKLLQPSEGDDGTDLFLREARTAGGLNHAGVVTIYDIGQDPDGTLYLVMELLQGRDLSAVLRHEGPPVLADAVNWGIQTADALAVAHAARIVHRDLKPANLMLTLSGNIKILDFGIARYASTVTQASRIIGTPRYMPPERLLGKAGDGRGDLYSLGCLLHELLTGSTPFGDLDTVALMYAHLHRSPEPPSARSLNVPEALDQLVLDLLAKDPDDRPATADQVRDRLRDLTTSPPAASRPEASLAIAERASTTPLSVLAQPVGTAHKDTARVAAPGATTVDSPAPTRRPQPADTLPEPSPPYSLHASLPSWPTPLQAPPPTAPTVRGPSPTKRLPGATDIPWTHEVDEGFLSSPVLADGTVYIGGRGRVFALDADTGAERWMADVAESSTSSSPAVAGGTVYISGGSGVHALDAATGTARWTHTDRNDVFYSPVVAGGTVYIRSEERKVYALDAATGMERWTHTARSHISVPVVAEGTVYGCGSNGRVYALDAITGAELWTHRADAFESSSPAVADGIVYFGSGDGLFYALDAATGTERWTYTIDASSSSSPAVVDGTVYVGDWTGVLCALDAATGAERWRADVSKTVDDDFDDVLSSPVVVEGIVYITSIDGKVLYALDAASGTEQWTHTSSDGVFNTPAVADGTVYITSEGGRVYTLDATTGTGPTA